MGDNESVELSALQSKSGIRTQDLMNWSQERQPLDHVDASTVTYFLKMGLPLCLGSRTWVLCYVFEFIIISWIKVIV